VIRLAFIQPQYIDTIELPARVHNSDYIRGPIQERTDVPAVF
jgi:hypothetical protein